LPQLPLEEATDLDVLFLRNVPAAMNSQLEMAKFLNSFGTDHLFEFHSDFCRIEPRNAQVSYRVQTFLPFLRFEGGPITLVHYPLFLPMLRISNLPTDMAADGLRELIPDLKSAQFLRKRTEADRQTAFVTVETVARADALAESLNYSVVGSSEIFVIRYTDEVHLRNLRRHQLYVTGFTDHRALRAHFSRFGPLLQAMYSAQFSMGYVQFFRKKDAVRAQSETTVIREEGTHVSVRDLSLLVSTERLIEILSAFGRMWELGFRDMTELHVLSVADVIDSSGDEAAACKRELSRTTVGDATLHVPVSKRHRLPDWKMSQRNQWIKLQNPDDFARCSEFSRVINWHVHGDVTYVMLDNVDIVAEILRNIDAAPITNYEFVHNVGNRDLEIIQVRSIPSPLVKPQFAVIEVDPLPDDFGIDVITEACADCGDYELYCSPSIYGPSRSRALIYAASRRVTKKIYTLLCAYRFSGELLRPRRVKQEDIRDPPPRKTKPTDKYGMNPVIMVDPVPWELRGEPLARILEEFQGVDVWDEPSGRFPDRNRVILRCQMTTDRKMLMSKLQSMQINGVPLSCSVVKTHLIREPLECPGEPRGDH
jgi:hypothetical protein